MSFKNFNLSDKMIESLDAIHFVNATEVQQEVIPLAMKGRKVICQSQTGTGKTHSFLIPIFEKINPESNTVQALVLAPTRELAEQIYNRAVELRDLYNPAIQIKRFIGGQDRQKSMEGLSTQPQIVIGTVGRLKDLFVKENSLRLDTAKMVVIDEADMTMEIGFLEDIDQMLSKMNKNIQIMVFSATIPEKLRPFLRKYLENVVTIEIQKQNVTSTNIKHVIIRSKNKSKEETLLDLFQMINPYLSLVFTNTREKTNELHKYLSENGYNAGIIHGSLESRERKRALKQIQELKYQYIVATDIAARGIDIEGVSHVVSIELPKDISFYIHRSGRTGRNQLSGESFIIYDQSDMKYLSKLESLGIEFEHVEIRKGQFVTLNPIFQRSKRTSKLSETEIKIRRSVKKSDKVKPNYKKKYEREVKSQLKRANRKASKSK